MQKMNKKIMTLALALGMSTGLALAQDCCQKAGGEQKKECCQKKNQSGSTLETILSRTSIRKYKDTPVEDVKVETMLRAAMAAPSAMNRQPWHFVVVTDRQLISQLSRQAGQSPLLIVVCGDLGKTGEGRGQEFWIQDASAATENLLLAAHAMGLGAVWTAQWPMDNRYKDTQRLLSLPETVMPLSMVIIGYPDEQLQPKDKWKPENVSYNKYGVKK